MLVFDSIIFKYNANPILRGVYLSIPKSCITGLFGINGCGKSTLLNIAAGFLTQGDGNIFINNEAVTKSFSVERYGKIGYLSQNSFLPKELKVIDLLEMDNCYINDDPLIEKIRNQKVLSLSSGELRYPEIKFLFSLNREYYLLDEPFTGIEPTLIEKVVHLIKVQKGLKKGILITDHYHRYVTEIIDRCYLLNDGHINEINQSMDFREGLLRAGYLANH